MTARSTTSLGEVRDSRAPAVLLELGYHDNISDARWVEENTDAIARNLVQSLTDYFDLPFIEPITPYDATVAVQSGNLNLRTEPSLTAPVAAQLPNGTVVRVYGVWQGWAAVGYGDLAGYVDLRYLR